jgi:hypothetical protein
MKKTIKLRDMTEEQWKEWRCSSCNPIPCKDCIFDNVQCDEERTLWIKHKDLYSDKFLDQTVEIEVPDLLTEEEKALLKQLVKLSAHRITGIEFGEEENDIYVGFMVAELLEDNERFDFKKGLFKGVEMGKLYSLSDLGLEDK